MPALTAQEFIHKDYSAALPPERLVEIYETMLLSRKLDERMWALHRQGLVAFHISGLGQEGCQVGAAFALDRNKDWVHPYYRDMALVLALGMLPRHLMLALFGRAEDPSSGGRQMPAHYGYRPSRIVSGSSPVATQVPQAAGIAFAAKLRGLDEVTLVTLGEGSTAQGDFHEGLNWAGIHRLPLIVLVENNQYAISEPPEKEMPVRNVADRGDAYGMPGVAFDGNDVLESYNVATEAVLRARHGEGPSLLEAKTYRPVPHSSDDDDRSYRSRDEVEMWKQRDPIVRYERLLRERKLLNDEEVQRITGWVMNRVDDATDYARAAALPRAEEALHPVFAEREATNPW
ncbi:MAG TPA: thiamine pyrophosphate-dependent dehydrogenase E1 component subunit alpha [Anaerolineae bacterium]